MNIYFTVFYILFLLGSFTYQLIVESKVDKAEKQEKGKVFSPWTHIFINLSYLSLFIIPVIEYFLSKRTVNPVISIIGICMVMFGVWGRNYSISFLKNYWSGDIEIKKNHHIVKEGPYAYMRHPAYFFMIMNGIGLCLIPNAYYSLVSVCLFYIFIMIIRMSLEEKVFLQELGKEYKKYRTEVFAFLPLKKVRKEGFDMSKKDIDILCCPGCKSDLDKSKGINKFYCASCNKDFTVNNGIFQFLPEEELKGDNKASQAFYNFFAPFYDLFNKVVLLFVGGEENARKEYMKELELRDGASVLEVSVGTGANLAFVPRFFKDTDLWGLDLSSAQLSLCNKKFKKRNIQAHLALGRAEKLPFKNESFDVVFHVGGINFFSDKKKAIEEMIRVAKPGTKIIVADETEKAKKMYEKMGIKPWEGENGPIFAPVDLIPKEMQDLKVFSIWKGFGYCMEFRKPR